MTAPFPPSPEYTVVGQLIGGRIVPTSPQSPQDFGPRAEAGTVSLPASHASVAPPNSGTGDGSGDAGFDCCPWCEEGE
jgi:hypothetical protein